MRTQIASARALGPEFVDQLEQAHLFRIANGDVRNELHTGNFSAAVMGGRPYVANLDPETLFDSNKLPAVPQLRFFQGKEFSPSNQIKLAQYTDLVHSSDAEAIFKDTKLPQRALDATRIRTEQMTRSGRFGTTFLD